MKKKIILVLALIIFIFLSITLIYIFSSSNDVISKYAKVSMDDLVRKNDANILFENDTELNTYTMQLSNGDKFVINLKDPETSVKYVLRLQPFLDAGLIIEKLPKYVVANTVENTLTITSVFEQKEYSSDAKTFEEAIALIISQYREKVEYHSILGHFGISLDNGIKFEWAKEIDKNDKDIVFVLDPEMFKNTGINLEKVEGWKYVEIPVSTTKKVFKLVQPYNLENK